MSFKLPTTWGGWAAVIGTLGTFVVGLAGFAGALEVLAPYNPVATKGYVESQMAGGFEPIQKLLMEQQQAIKEGFAAAQWTAAIDRQRQMTFQLQTLDTQLQADMKDYDTYPTGVKRELDRRQRAVDALREDLEKLTCQIEQHDVNAVC